MNYNMIASLDKLSFTDLWISGKMKTELVDFPGPKLKTNDTRFIGIQLKVFRKGANSELGKPQQINLGEEDF